MPQNWRAKTLSNRIGQQPAPQSPEATKAARDAEATALISDQETRQAISTGAGVKARERALSFPKGASLEELTGIVHAARAETFRETSDIVDLKQDAPNHSMLAKAGEFIEKEEGMRLGTYKDTKGIPTIGVGFNLNRKDARQKLEDMGYNYDDVKAGKSGIRREDAVKLRDVVVQEEMNWLRGRLEGEGIDTASLKSHQWQALLSLSYNGRVLIGPSLVGHIKDGNWAGAEREIREFSNGNRDAKPSVIRGIDERRNREANKFRGTQEDVTPPKPRARPQPGV